MDQRRERRRRNRTQRRGRQTRQTDSCVREAGFAGRLNGSKSLQKKVNSRFGQSKTRKVIVLKWSRSGKGKKKAGLASFSFFASRGSDVPQHTSRKPLPVQSAGAFLPHWPALGAADSATTCSTRVKGHVNTSEETDAAITIAELIAKFQTN